MLVIVVGRGNGGTRLLSDTLSKSGVYMGPVNIAGDLIPPDKTYQAAKIVGNYIDFDFRTSLASGCIPWSFDKLMNADPTPEFISLIQEYIKPILDSTSENKGWKIPETLLIAPWIFKMFPDAHYIYWTRDPRDTVVTPHTTDDLSKFNVKSVFRGGQYSAGLESWIYQTELMKRTPKPSKIIEVKFENFVLNQDQELQKISSFLNIPLVKVLVDTSQVGNYKNYPGTTIFDHILKGFGYID